jgi:hypothetical protein
VQEAAEFGLASSFEGIMSPIALADARTTTRGLRFCLALVALLLMSVSSFAEVRYASENLSESSRISQFIHSITIRANFSPAVQGQAYASTLEVAGGLAPFKFWVEQGALPPGLSLNASTGVISGVPAVSGTFAFTIAAFDSRHGFGRQFLQFNVGPSTPLQISISLSPQSLQVAPGSTVQFAAVVKNTPQTAVLWSASAGSITPNGLFTAPSGAGTVVVTATAAASNAVRSSASILVQSIQKPSPLAISTTALSSAQVNVPYTASIIAQGGALPYNWSVASGSLPSGLSLDPGTGVLTGSISQPGAFTFTAEVTDASGQISARQLTLNSTAVRATNFDGPAELPRTTVQSTMADTPAPGNTINVPAGANVQTAINSANCGDTIQLQAGATFTGSFVLPAKSCDDNNWIIIRSSASDASLPAEGTRINPCYAGVMSLPGRPAFTCSNSGVMARIIATKGTSPLTLAAGANHYRIGPGLELTRPVGTGIAYGMVAKQDTPADHIIIDRDWIHGTAQDDTVRGVFLGGIVYAAVIDSYLNDFHCAASIGACTDAQAIAGGTGTQPQGTWKIENNFLEASAENILFGGSGGTTVPTDITVRHNHMFKPLIWMPGQPGFVGAVTDPTKCANYHQPGRCPFVVKNLFELKNAQRVLLEGNVLENTWAGFSQYATAIPLQALNQPGSNNPNTTVADVTIRFNRIAHAANAFSANIVCLSCSVNPAFTGRISVHDDIFDDLNASFYGLGDVEVNTAKPFQISQCPTCNPVRSVAINHVTVLMATPKTFMVIGDTSQVPIQDVNVTNSIVSSLPGTVITATGNGEPCAFQGVGNLARLSNCLAPGYNVTRNALIAASGAWPAGNYMPPDPGAVEFTDYSNGNGGDYHLLPSSPYKNAGSDGADVGANVDAVNEATAGAL